MSLYIQEEHINADQNVIYGSVEPYETSFDEVGPLFRSLRKEWGACVSKVYRSTLEGDDIPIGWVFQKRVPYEGRIRYDDYGKQIPWGTYLREVWITVHAAAPTIVKHVIDINTGKEVA